MLLTDLSSHWGLSFTWTCLVFTIHGPEPGRVYNLQGLELHLNVPRQLLLDFSTLQGPELHQDVSTLNRPVLNLEVWSKGA